MLITGGAGFIGSNAALYFTRGGWDVRVLDNFSRPGSEKNAGALSEEIPLQVRRGDVRCLDDNGKAGLELAWGPTVPVRQGLDRLVRWAADHLEEIQRFHPRSALGPTRQAV
jgi:nucleoside-diphosphate-sugar epimerase